jgi:phosphoadenosine phosphosulfate reductase
VNDVPAAGDGSTTWFSEAELTAANQRLEEASPLEILGWTFEHFRGRRVALSSAFGAEGCALIHLARQIEATVPVYTIDTGYLFAETLVLREAYRATGADIRVVEPLLSIRSQAERHGPDLFARDSDACCEIRKVEPMRRILTFLDVWITAVRRDQSETRKNTPIVGTARRSDGSLVVKVAPWPAGHARTRGVICSSMSSPTIASLMRVTPASAASRAPAPRTVPTTVVNAAAAG